LFVQGILLQLLELGLQVFIVDGFSDLGARDGVDDLFAERVALP
jgi:hypothetical protein